MTKGILKDVDTAAFSIIEKQDKSKIIKSGISTNPTVTLDRINLLITQELLQNSSVKTATIAHKLNLPLSTVQRRRKRLEESPYLKKRYEIDVKQFGFRKADILISTLGGECVDVAKEIADKYPANILEISQRIGDPEINLVALAIYKDTKELYNILEDIRGMENVEGAEWSEIVNVIQRNDGVVIPNLISNTTQSPLLELSY